MQNMLYVGIGGFLGAITRYVLAGWVTQAFVARTNWALPVGTAFVNITGSFALALFLAWATHQVKFASEVRLLIGTGFFGAYTTFSTYANESISLWQTDWRLGLGNMVLMNALCVLGVLLGLALAQRLWGSGAL